MAEQPAEPSGWRVNVVNRWLIRRSKDKENSDASHTITAALAAGARKFLRRHRAEQKLVRRIQARRQNGKYSQARRLSRSVPNDRCLHCPRSKGQPDA